MMKHGFTLVEILFVIALVAILSVGTMSLLNPMAKITQAFDTRRKEDLTTLNRVLEDYYNDARTYPKASDFCFDQAHTYGSSSCFCHVCFNGQSSQIFKTYFSRTVCDPSHPRQDYTYEFDANGSSDCANARVNWYRICTILNPNNLGLGYPTPSVQSGLNYGISSPNTSPFQCNIIGSN